jgi:hypothetical protein
VLVNIVIVSMEDVEKADESEEEIEFESWFINESVEEDTIVMRCVVADEKCHMRASR